jgi:lantibiotic modifying enzyme
MATEISSWRPLFVGEPAERLRARAREILTALEPTAAAEIDPWVALLYEYSDRDNHEAEHAQTISDILLASIDSIATGTPSFALYGGFTGVAWLVAHVADVDDEDEDPNEEIDAALHSLVTRSPWASRYDLIRGLVGIGVYFLERIRTHRSRSLAAVCLEAIVERLHELGLRTPEGITWLTPPNQLPDWQRKLAPDGYYNLGVAHGLPGVISFLGQTHEAGINPRLCGELLGASIDWLLAQSLNEIPNWLTNGTAREASGGSGVAWCHGGLGLSAALLRAARAVGETRWEKVALALALKEAKRRGESARAPDAALCHGAAGVAHLFNRLFQATGEAPFADAAQHWFERTLEFSPALSTPGFLDGKTGIGLALLAATSHVEPNWDRLLLVSIPPL